MSGLFSYITGSPFLYLEFFEMTSRQYGYIFSINSIGFVAASQINAKILKKTPLNVALKRALWMPAIAALALIFLAPIYPNFYFVTFLFFITLCSCGMIMPNTSALALANHAERSGSASALLGTIQFFLATIMSLLISNLHDGSIMPTCVIVGVCSFLPLVINKFTTVRRQ